MPVKKNNELLIYNLRRDKKADLKKDVRFLFLAILYIGGFILSIFI